MVSGPTHPSSVCGGPSSARIRVAVVSKPTNSTANVIAIQKDIPPIIQNMTKKDNPEKNPASAIR